MSALDSLVRDGKVRYVGCSNFLAWQLGLALAASDRHHLARFDCVQPRYNMLARDIEADLLPLCANQGIGVIAYNPLAGGLLTGKYAEVSSATEAPPETVRFGLGGSTGTLYRNRYWHDEELQVVSGLNAWLQTRGKTLAQAAIAWLLRRPELTSAIVGATSAAQLKQTLPAVDLQLDAEEMAACDAAWYRLPRRAPQR